MRYTNSSLVQNIGQSNWAPSLRLDGALEYLVSWYKSWDAGADMHVLTLEQIERYNSLSAK